jgi:cytochrome c-type biogenesis protein CcmH/NrfG
MPRHAEDYYREALRINPSFADAQSALAEITG